MKTHALLLALAATPLAAHDYAVGDLTIAHPVSYPTTGMTGAGYMEITNTGELTEQLVFVSGPFARGEMHESRMDDDGMMRMERQDVIEIAPGETVTLQPGGLHVMFMGLSGPLEIGDEIPATLVFERAGEIEVVFEVAERPAGGAMDHAKDGE